MKNGLYDIYTAFFVLCSLSPCVLLFMVNQKDDVFLLPDLVCTSFPCLAGEYEWCLLIEVFLIMILVSFVTKWLLCAKCRSKDRIEIKGNEIKRIYSASPELVPLFIAYVVIGLSVGSWSALFLVLIALFILTSISSCYLYSPFVYIWRFKYYFLELEGRGRVLLISRKIYNLGDKVKPINTVRFNNLTYIENGYE